MAPDQTKALGGEAIARLSRVTVEGVEQKRPPSLPARFEATGTRLRLYEAALRLFAERGYHAVSVRDLVKELDLRASSFYAHVPSKQHLLEDLIRVGHEEHRDALGTALAGAGDDPAEQISALMRAHVLFHCAHPLLGRLCNRELGSLEGERRAETLGVRVDAERLFDEVIERGQRLGVFAPVDPLLAVAAIGAMGIRVAEWWHPGLDVSADDVAEAYAGFALRLLT